MIINPRPQHSATAYTQPRSSSQSHEIYDEKHHQPPSYPRETSISHQGGTGMSQKPMMGEFGTHYKAAESSMPASFTSRLPAWLEADETRKGVRNGRVLKKYAVEGVKWLKFPDNYRSLPNETNMEMKTLGGRTIGN